MQTYLFMVFFFNDTNPMPTTIQITHTSEVKSDLVKVVDTDNLVNKNNTRKNALLLD